MSEVLARYLEELVKIDQEIKKKIEELIELTKHEEKVEYIR